MTAQTTTQQTIDQENAQAFVGQVFGDLTGLTDTVLASIGDRLGLFKDLAPMGRPPAATLASLRRAPA